MAISSWKLFDHVVRSEQGEETGNVVLDARRLTQGEKADAFNRVLKAFNTQYADLLSCYQLQGEFGLWAALQNFQNLHPDQAGLKELDEAAEAGNISRLEAACMLSLEKPFVALVENQAFKRLQLIDAFPAEAQAQFNTMWRHAKLNADGSRNNVVVANAPEPEPIAEPSALDQCVADWKSLSTAAFRAKWPKSNPQLNRIVEEMFATGRV
jgi:hypothetical protein